MFGSFDVTASITECAAADANIEEQCQVEISVILLISRFENESSSLVFFSSIRLQFLLCGFFAWRDSQ